MTNEQIEAVARAIASDLAAQDFNTFTPPENWDFTFSYLDQGEVDFRLVATAAIAAMPDRYAEGYAAAKVQAVGVCDYHLETLAIGPVAAANTRLITMALSNMEPDGSAPAKAEGWQPIETAPRDGTVVMFFDAEYYANEHSDRYHVCRADDYWNGGFWLENCTHWQPLPAPPTMEPEKY